MFVVIEYSEIAMHEAEPSVGVDNKKRKYDDSKSPYDTTLVTALL
jgi:hypothetical protein